MSCAAHALAISRRFLDWADVDLIRELVSKLPKLEDVRVVDLGAGSGTTAGSVLCERDYRIHVFTYDHDATAIGSTGEFITNIGAAELWTGYIMDSLEGVAFWEDGSIDLLLIDTSHTYEQTVAELAAWLPKVKPEGWVWLHDYRGEPGVAQAIEEAENDGRLERWKVEGLGWAGNRPRLVEPTPA